MIYFLNKSSIGLDISDRTIEVVKLVKINWKVKIESLNRAKLSPGIVERGRIKNKERLGEEVKKVLADVWHAPIKTREILFALPESQVYNHIFNLKEVNEKEREELILKEALNNIPIEGDDLVYSYKVISKSKDITKILIVASSLQVILEWQQFFNENSLRVNGFDNEILANFRSIFLSKINYPICLVDIGSATTNITIFNDGNLHYSNIVFKAGDFFTREIEKKLKLTPNKAEDQKLIAGLNKGNKVSGILIKSIKPILDELQLSIDFWQKNYKQKIKKIVLVGGSARLKGLIDYLSSNLKIDTNIGTSIFRDKKADLLYLGAIGIALRGINKEWAKDPIIKIPASHAHNPKEESEKEQNGAGPERQNAGELNGQEKIMESDNSANIKFKIIALIITLIIGAVLISLAFWYRGTQINKREVKLKVQIEQYTKAISSIVDSKSGQEEASSDTEIIKKADEANLILIKETPTGWLNVRQGPNVSFPIIAKVNPGERYILLEENNGWANIKLSEDEEGWVFDMYTEK
ncbi:MAG: pilus assembly protein PilM [Patescibacteria group bacterium]